MHAHFLTKLHCPLPWTHMDECPEGCWVIASHDCNPLNLNVANRPSQCIGLNELPYNGCQIKVQLWLRWEMICRKDDISKSLEQLSGLTVHLTVLRLLFKPSCPTASPISVTVSKEQNRAQRKSLSELFSSSSQARISLWKTLFLKDTVGGNKNKKAHENYLCENWSLFYMDRI